MEVNHLCALRFTLTLSKVETLEPIDAQFCTIDYVAKISGCAKKYNNRLNGGAPTHTQNIMFCVNLFPRSQSHAQPERRIAQTSKDVFSSRKYFLGSR